LLCWGQKLESAENHQALNTSLLQVEALVVGITLVEVVEQVDI
jgi:hypothetical protein